MAYVKPEVVELSNDGFRAVHGDSDNLTVKTSLVLESLCSDFTSTSAAYLADE